MHPSLPHPIRGHGRRLLVVVAGVLAALVSLARPSGAAGVPVAPVPAGVWPLQPEPRVVRAFDPPASPWGVGHRGVDLGGTVGQVVHTALAGRVTFAARLAGRGVVVVDHGATRTTYEPVAASVRVGDVLARGQPVGTLELARSHCLPQACLHWGWRRGSVYLDPLLLVGGGRVVLLPLWRGPPTVRSIPVQPPYAALVSRLLDRSPPRSARTDRSRWWAPVPSQRWVRPLAMRPLLL